MQLRAAIAAAVLLAASTLAARADGTLVVEVTNWDPVNRVLTFNDRTQVANVTPDLGLPEDIKPGDVIVTGTPAGVGLRRDPQVWMKDGDIVEIDLEGVGVLKNRIVKEAAA